jgi:hypothetical protein
VADSNGLNRLFFAGEHTSKWYRGTVHGAWISGQRAASEAIPNFSKYVSSRAKSSAAALYKPPGLVASVVVAVLTVIAAVAAAPEV